MNGRTQNKIIKGLLIVGVILFLSFIIRTIFLLPNFSNDKICELEYGESWVYDSSNFGRTCTELDFISLEIINRTELEMSYRDAIKRYCDVPRFFELNRWSNNCIE